MAGLLDWLLGPAQGPGTPQIPPEQQPWPQQGQQPQQGGGILTRMGDALIGMSDPYGMMDKSSLTPEARQQMIGQTLLQLGTGIANSNSRNPLGALGQGMQYAQQQGQQTGENRLKGLMYKSQIGKMETENRTKDYLKSRGKPAWFTGSADDWSTYVDSDPAGAFKSITNPPEAKAYRIGPDGQTIVDPTILSAEMAKRAAGRTSVVNNVDMRGESEFAKVAGKKDAERFDEYVTSGNSAREFRANLDALTQLASRFQTGKEAEFKAAVGPYLQALGVDVSNLGDIQSYQGIVDRMAPAMRVPGSGATSDFEMRKFLSALPQLGRTPEGNATVSAVLDGIMQNRVKAAQIATQALTGEISRQEANKQIMALPDPLAAWKEAQKNLPVPAPTQPAPAKVRTYNPATRKFE